MEPRVPQHASPGIQATRTADDGPWVERCPQRSTQRAHQEHHRDQKSRDGDERDAGGLTVLDGRVRSLVAGPLERVGRRLAEAGIAPGAVTGLGFALGVGACVAAAWGRWTPALVLWLANRLADGLDGPIARARGASALGGFADIVADFTVYSGFVLGVAVAEPGARLACVALLAAYYVSGAAFLAWSAVAEQLHRERPDERSLHFVGGVAEGTETIVVYVLFCLFPGSAETIAWVFAALVAVTAMQRVAFVWSTLNHHNPRHR